MLPFLIPEGELPFKNGDYLFVPQIRKAVEEKADSITVYVVGDTLKEFSLTLGELTDDEREIILKGCLINYNRKQARPESAVSGKAELFSRGSFFVLKGKQGKCPAAPLR